MHIDDSRIAVHTIFFNILLAILLMYILKRNFNWNMQFDVPCWYRLPNWVKYTFVIFKTVPINWNFTVGWFLVENTNQAVSFRLYGALDSFAWHRGRLFFLQWTYISLMASSGWWQKMFNVLDVYKSSLQWQPFSGFLIQNGSYYSICLRNIFAWLY